jgi:hypothetical protein
MLYETYEQMSALFVVNPECSCCIKLTNGGDSTVNHNRAGLFASTLELPSLPLRAGISFPPML